MKTIPLRLTEKSFSLLHRFLGRAELKGHEVPEFLQLLQELRAAPQDEATSKSAQE